MCNFPGPISGFYNGDTNQVGGFHDRLSTLFMNLNRRKDIATKNVVIAINDHGNTDTGEIDEPLLTGGGYFTWTPELFWEAIRDTVMSNLSRKIYIVTGQCYGGLFAKSLENIIRRDLTIELSNINNLKIIHFGDGNTYSSPRDHLELNLFFNKLLNGEINNTTRHLNDNEIDIFMISFP